LSRNRERSGAKKSISPPPSTNENNESGAFSFVVPTEFVELPSAGRFYPQGHPLHNQSTIEIKQMTAKEEDLLTSRALLKKGIALDRLLASIIVNKAVRPEHLLVGDRNAILIATRISGYGPNYETKIVCPSCGENQEYSFNLDDIGNYDGTDLLDEEATDNGNGTFTALMPKTKVEVTFRLLNGSDEKNLLTQSESARKSKRNENNVTRQLKQMIVAVNGDTSQQSINYFSENMPSMDARHLRYVYTIASPNVDMSQNFECNSCGYEQELEVPLTADFFWPDR
jgi:hypothetical protein